MLANFPKSHAISSTSKPDFLKVIQYVLLIRRIANLHLNINGGKLQQSPAKHIFPLHIERASCSKFCCRGGHCTQ